MATDDIEIRPADTFFLGTTHSERGNDASHRGGPAGFVYADHKTLECPDYGQQHVQQFRQPRGRPDRRAAVHRLPQRAHAAAVGQRARHVGRPSRRRRHRTPRALFYSLDQTGEGLGVQRQLDEYMALAERLTERHANPRFMGGSDDEAARTNRCGQERLSVKGQHLAHRTDGDDA
jgi:hypothetical protein